MKAVVVSHGEVDPGDVAHVRGADLVIAADGGSLHLERWGIEPHHVVGDLDSLPDETRERILRSGGSVEVHPRDKDRTDTEIALDRALASGADEIVIVGALGGPRIDHALANTLLLMRDGLGPNVRIVRGPMSMQLVRGGETVRLTATPGEVVSLLPVGIEPAVVETRGLRFPLRREGLPVGSARGVSNEITETPASVRCVSGALLLIQGGSLAPRQEPQPKA